MSDTIATSETSAAQAVRPRGRAVDITLWVLQALLAFEFAMGRFLNTMLDGVEDSRSLRRDRSGVNHPLFTRWLRH